MNQTGYRNWCTCVSGTHRHSTTINGADSAFSRHIRGSEGSKRTALNGHERAPRETTAPGTPVRIRRQGCIRSHHLVPQQLPPPLPPAEKKGKMEIISCTARSSPASGPRNRRYQWAHPRRRGSRSRGTFAVTSAPRRAHHTSRRIGSRLHDTTAPYRHCSQSPGGAISPLRVWTAQAHHRVLRPHRTIDQYHHRVPRSDTSSRPPLAPLARLQDKVRGRPHPSGERWHA
ncbi:hypothetical protein B0H16DRAFT_528492 [Mycena metata]|uniref:Uncharacterized protein n=1 Tax=Mycena metata TaxID=1033252 RepID=A0AAD7NI74_9AGAR|nr:hypothetical protein B0H16DRAFT_528492 [Mycena metata]